jgi:EpsI family protein
VALLVALVYRDSFASMADLWRLTSYRHAYFVWPVSLYLLWLKRSELGAVPVTGSLWGALAALVLVMLYLVARAMAVQAVEHFVVVAMIPALALTLLGAAAFRVVAFPILFVLAAVPVGEEIVPFLLRVTADVSEWLLRLSGVPFLRQGLFFSLPGGDFEIAVVCSGFKNLIAGIVIALLFGYLNFVHWGQRALFVVLTAVSFILMNGARAFVVMVVSSMTEGRVLGGEDHVYFGMVLFASLLLLLLWVGHRYADRPANPSHEVGPASGGAQWTRVAVAGAMAVAFLALGPTVLAARQASATGIAAAPVLPQFQGCTIRGDWQASWSPRLSGASRETGGSFDCEGTQVHAFIAAYTVQSQGKELVSERNEIIPHGWRRHTNRSVQAFVSPEGTEIRVNEAQVTNRGWQVVVWYWYEVAGTAARTGAEVKLLEAAHALDPTPRPSLLRLVAAEGPEGDTLALHERVKQAAADMVRPAASGRDG